MEGSTKVAIPSLFEKYTYKESVYGRRASKVNSITVQTVHKVRMGFSGVSEGFGVGVIRSRADVVPASIYSSIHIHQIPTSRTKKAHEHHKSLSFSLLSRFM